MHVHVAPLCLGVSEAQARCSSFEMLRASPGVLVQCRVRSPLSWGALQPAALLAARRGFHGSRSTARDSRVAALDFRISRQDAIYRARLAALEQLLPLIKGRWGAAWFAVMHSLGLGALADSEDSVMHFESARAVYLPVWAVDAIWKVRCSGDAGSAKATFVTTSSTFPGNGWKPMDTVPLYPPPPANAEGSEETSNVISGITGQDDPAEYAPFSAERHLHPDESLGLDDGITVLPFTISPRSLPAALQEASLRDLLVNMASDGPELQINKRFRVLPGIEIQVANMETRDDVGTNATVRIDRGSVELEMLACYPVLLPIHLVQFRYVPPGSDPQRATVALGAWGANLLAYAMRTPAGTGWLTKHGFESALDLDIVDFAPHVPTSGSGGSQGGSKTDTRVVDLLAQQSHYQAVFEHRAQELLENADWTFSEAWERTAAEQSGVKSPEQQAGLGNLDWDAKELRFYSEEELEANRTYAALYGEELFAARLLESVEKSLRTGADPAQLSTMHQGRLITGDDAVNVLRERLQRLSERRAAERPAWLEQATKP